MISSCWLYVGRRAFAFHGFQTQAGPDPGSSRKPVCALVPYRLPMNDRGVFLKTVFSAYKRFDSVQAKIDTDTGSILCQKIVTSGRQHLILNHGSRVTKLWREIRCRSLGMESRHAIVPKKGSVRLLYLKSHNFLRTDCVAPVGLALRDRSAARRPGLRPLF